MVSEILLNRNLVYMKKMKNLKKSKTHKHYNWWVIERDKIESLKISQEEERKRGYGTKNRLEK